MTITTNAQSFLRVHLGGDHAQIDGDLRFDKEGSLVLEPVESILARANIIGLGAGRFDPQVDTTQSQLLVGRAADRFSLLVTNHRLIWHLPPVRTIRKKQGSLLGSQWVWGSAVGTAIWAGKKAARKITEQPTTVEGGQVRLEHIAGISVPNSNEEMRTARLILLESDQDQVMVNLTVGWVGKIAPFIEPIVVAAARRQLELCAAYLKETQFADACARLRKHVNGPVFGQYPNGDLLYRLQGHFALYGSAPWILRPGQ